SAMVILALVFGSLVAMGLPIVSAAIGLAISTSVIGLMGHLSSVPTVAPTLATMIGLGVGIDYALFLMTKHKEQLDDGVEVRESIAGAVASSGSAIVFAGGTVVVALLSLSVAGIPLVTMLGLASAIAVFIAVLTSITLLPAILSLVGHGVERVRIPRFLRMEPRPAGHRRWDAWARWVTRHPWIAVVTSLAILVPLIVPLFSLELGQPDVGVTPTSTTQRQA
ncbi:MAG: MMPL family transporter, partial [Actinomycetota bacterium]